MSAKKKAKVAEYTVVIHEEGGDYWVEVPSLPGCTTTGDTITEALVNAQEAIASHLLALKEDGQKIPVESKLVIRKVKVAA